jgi:protein-tyrosine phosphatase
MHRIEPYRLWLGHAGDLRSPSTLFESGIRAVVDLASNEPIPQLPRDLTYCRFPLFDGGENERWLLRAAVRTTVEFLIAEIPTVICCSVGLSRSLAIAAAAISAAKTVSMDDALIHVASQGKHDVSPALWQEVKAAVRTA